LFVPHDNDHKYQKTGPHRLAPLLITAHCNMQ
jgi:hypothetical protein